MNHENEPLPVCNFCESEYDPFDMHTCKGNQIQPRKPAKVVEDEGGAGDPPTVEDLYRLTEACSKIPYAEGWGPSCEALMNMSPEERKHENEIRARLGFTPIVDAPARVPLDYPDFEGLPPPMRPCVGGMTSALETQPGGDHYRKHAIQPVEYIVANGLDFLQGNIVKYATRHKDKGGAADVRKIIHYAQIILELQYKETPK